MPFLQSVSAAHWTQVPPLQTGVEGGQFAFPVHPVEATQTLLLLHTWPPGQSVLAMHCTHLGNGLTRQTGVAAGQSCTWVATVQTGLHAPIRQRGVGAAQSASARHCLTTQVFELHTSPAAHWVSSTQATQTPGLPLLPGLQCGAAVLEAQSFSVVQVVALACRQTFWTGSQTCPAGQSEFCRQATQAPPGLQCGVG